MLLTRHDAGRCYSLLVVFPASRFALTYLFYSALNLFSGFGHVSINDLKQPLIVFGVEAYFSVVLLLQFTLRVDSSSK